jgi:hypothetical protein
MNIPIRANATDIVFWANRRDAQANLPNLVRKLAWATTKRIERIQFRSGEGISLSGWDGMIQVPEGNAIIPQGISGWELTTEKDSKGKADDMFESRSIDPGGLDSSSSTFVFVTARRWSHKDDWIGEMKKKGIWKDIRAYDADDLDSWLEQAPAVDLWFSIMLDKHPLGSIDLESYWNKWSRSTNPPLNSDLVIAGREENISEIQHWLNSEPSILGLQAESQDEAIAYFVSSLFHLPEEERENALARAIVVKDDDAWSQLELYDSPLILIPIFPDRRMVTMAVENGHRILFPLDRSEPPIGNTLTLSRLHRAEAEKALAAMGIPQNRIKDLAVLSRRNLEAMRRELAKNAVALIPEWAKQPKIARTLLPALLAGRWDDEKVHDQEAISSLAGRDYSELREVLISWSQKPDPPVRLVEHTWTVTAGEDIWRLLARYLTNEVLERFASVARDALVEPDPKFELPVDERWLANIHGKVPKYSVYLRGGIAETLALMATLSDPCTLATRSGQDWANQIVGAIFEGTTDWKLWASLSQVLPSLAEASPEIFLRAVERNLATTCPSLIQIFTDSENILTQSSPHTGLLWALEVLAWSPEYLGQSALLLASLARLDPGGKLSNRPLGSLREIFLLWHQGTAANLEQRLRVLDMIRHREQNVAWELMVKLIPSSHCVAFPTFKPKYRNWLPEVDNLVPFVEISRAVTEIVGRLIEDVSTDGVRWRALIELLDDLPKPEFDMVIDRLLAINLEVLGQANSLQIWEALRQMLSKHLQFPDAKWVLPLNDINRLRQCYERFEPEDPVQKSIWLFSHQCSFTEGGFSRGRERDEMINRARIKAAEELFDGYGLPRLLELISKAEDAYLVGQAVGKSRILSDQEGTILNQILGSIGPAQSRAASGFLHGRAAINGLEWLNSLRSSELWEEWTLRQHVDYYLCLPFDKHTWFALSAEENEIQRLYWLEVGINGRGDLEIEDCKLVISKIADSGRIETALDFMALYRIKFVDSPRLVATVLESAIKTAEKVNWSHLAYEVPKLLNLLETSTEIEKAQLIQFELFFLPLLHNSMLSPKILHEALNEDPEFFVQILRWLYRSKSEKPSEPKEEQQIRARIAFDLLQSWKRPPGVNEDKSVNPEKLMSWIARARESARLEGLEDTADYYIGQVLANYPEGADGAWPHEALRDLVEELRSENIENGVIAGIYGKRGVVIRSIRGGGSQERDIVERYASFSRIMRDKWPRTALLMKAISSSYESDARREDKRWELIEDLGN